MISDFAAAAIEAAGGQIEELVTIDLGDRRGVGAAHIVGEDLESRDRVGMRLGGEQQVAALLEGVGLLGAGVDFDHPPPDRGRAGAEHAAEGQVGVSVRRRVLLGRVVVEVLAGAAGVATGHPRLGARPGQVGLHPHLASPEPKPRAAQSSRPSRSTSARWEEKIQADSEMSWVLT